MESALRRIYPEKFKASEAGASLRPFHSTENSPCDCDLPAVFVYEDMPTQGGSSCYWGDPARHRHGTLIKTERKTRVAPDKPTTKEAKGKPHEA